MNKSSVNINRKIKLKVSENSNFIAIIRKCSRRREQTISKVRSPKLKMMKRSSYHRTIQKTCHQQPKMLPNLMTKMMTLRKKLIYLVKLSEREVYYPRDDSKYVTDKLIDSK